MHSTKAWSSFFVSACLFVCIVLSAWADDLEIYLGVGGQQVTYNPNVLFIMDTSGSMTNKDGGTESRMLRVQNALKEALSSSSNINAGLMRFSDYGGPIIYPVREIDDAVEPELIIGISSTSDDAYELGGSVNLNSNSVVISQGLSDVTSGFRFQNVNIPQGANIVSASLKFISANQNIADTAINISGELTPNAAAFAETALDLSSRTKTTNTVTWDTNNGFPSENEEVASPDIASILQEIVDQPDWCGGNAANFLLNAVSNDVASARLAKAADAGEGSVAQLVVEYDHLSATGCVQGELSYQVSSQNNNAEEPSNGYQSTGSELTFSNNYNRFIGLRFESVAVPQNAEITDAYLEFTAYQKRTGSGASFVISASAEGDVDDFSSYPRYLLRDKAKTSSVTWNNIPSWYKNSVYRTPSIASVVQDVVNRGDWQVNNDMMFIISSITGNRGAYSYRGKPSGAPRLVVKYKGKATPNSVATVRSHLINKVDELRASGYTPIVDTLYEAASYYGGRAVYYGRTRGNSNVNSTVRRNTRVSHRLSYTGSDSVLPSGCSEDNLNDADCINQYIPSGATYQSPVTDLQCQTNNHIVLLSDGEANNNHSVDEIEALLGQSCTGSGGEKCGLDLVRNIADSEVSAIDTRVTTHTIGFAANATANNFLNQIALQSGGGFYTADNSDDLVTAFQTILRNVKDVNATFVSPGVAVNQLNRLTHKDELYFALFKPAEGTRWPGNLKKYRLDSDVIRDRNGVLAVNNNTGFFDENAHSYWSTLADGNDVRQGGAASNLDLVRDVYFFNAPGNIAISSNRLSENNITITTTDLAIDSEPNPNDTRNAVLKWARGVDVLDDDGDGDTTDTRLQLGDPIHSQPVIVNYSDTESAVFVATNHGFLHSFDPNSGEENFAVIPKELLSNLHDIYLDNSSFTHIYGLDGDMVLRDRGAKKYLYLGMRRGGNNYYAFDVSSKSAPKLVFRIQGGSPGFEKLGQTWSRPTITKIKVGSSVREVLIFGGGYDESQDSKALRSPDVVGNAVYIVDADTGQLIWRASNDGADLNLPEMLYSIPARISAIDRDTDGLADHLYVADTGGQLFRLDIKNGEPLSDLISGGVLASFSNDGTEADNRRFYYAPDVSEISLADEHYYAVAIGSGYRAHPLNTVIQDQLYMIKDKGVFEIDVDGNYTLPVTPYTQSELYDATDHLLTSQDQEQQELEVNAFVDKEGWFIRLGSGGEKVLASPLILNYRLFFTTYLPATASLSQCAPPTGNSRAYLVELVNGNAVTDLNRNNTKEHQDRFADLKQTGIAPETKILIEDLLKPVVCLGTECTEIVDDGDECNSEFECLAENLYGRFERLQRNSWQTENERQ
ncbi:PilC/PilY family type IV pilus protein [Alteromonas sp. a30]|uniref:PilC/PilY family type IV pilus protein n=1 Tax=Alteromonas sp. a30 TaxID=2730917 RepID=UPI0022811360|nr:PilC/PilY family type IV pilus protein [Alteromonas sp. a30]